LKSYLHTPTALFIVLLMLLSHVLCAQAPIITYTSPQTYTVGTSVGTVTPTNSGGAVPAATVYTVTTFAGSGAAGRDNLTGTAATFNLPRGISSDASGNLYIADASNNEIRKITPAAAVSLFAGNTAGTSGSANGTGSAAFFNNPYDITTDPSGNFYVADYNNNMIRKITPAGVVTNYASVNQPAGIIYNSFSGNFIVSRIANNDLVKISLGPTTGTVSTFVGSTFGVAGRTNGTGAFATFNAPNGLSDDDAGNIYVADQGNHEIRKVTSAGVVTLFAGSAAGTPGSANGTGSAASFNNPRGVNVYGGNIYISDSDNNLIRMITPAGVVTTIAGNLTPGFTNGAGTAAAFSGPRGLEVDDATGHIYVADLNNNAIRKIVPTRYKKSGKMPAGLSFNTTTGVISGTPTVTSSATTYTITATNTFGTSTTTVSISIGPAVTTPAAICGAGTTPTMTASGGNPAGGTYNWYTLPTGGNLVNTGATYAPTLALTTTFYVDYTISGATTPRTPVTATVNPIVSSPLSGPVLSYIFNGDASDISGNSNPGTLQGSPTPTTDRFGNANSAFTFNGSTQYVSTTKQYVNPTAFSISLWFNTTVAGGKLIGFGNQQTGSSGSNDRHIYMNNLGQLYFGLYNGAIQVINTTRTYNDGLWHHVVVTVGAGGSKMYVDNAFAAQNVSMTTPEVITGYWRIGYDNVNTWTSQPTNFFFTGKLDDIAIYNRELTAAEIITTNNVNIIGSATAVCVGSPITLIAPDIPGATYSWVSVANTSNTSATNPATFASASTGGYTLTVVASGCTSTATVTPTVNSVPAAVTFTASPTTVAVGANTTVTLTSTVVAGITYTWDTDGGTPATNTGTTAFTVNWATAGAKVITLTATNASGCTTTATQTVIVTKTIASGNYAYSHPITLTLPSGTISGTLTNFPALVYIKEDALKTGLGCANNVSSTSGGVNGYDFAFTTDVGINELFYQVESFDQTTGTLLVWVQVPTLGITTTNLKFYFGSLTPAHTAGFAKATWSSDYQAIYHFNEGSAAATVLDATSNSKNAAQTSTAVATGQINSAYQFNGTSSKIISTSTANNITGSFTLSAWVKPTAPYTLSSSGAYDYKLITNEALNYTTAGYKLGLYGSTPTNVYPEVETRPNTGEPASTTRSTSTTQTAVTVNGWHYVQGVYNSATSTFYTYLDGQLNLTKTGAIASGSTGQSMYLGSDFGAGNFLNGALDEVRVSNTPKSSDWIKAEYYNQNNQLTFTTSSSTITAVPANVAAIGGSLAYTWTGAAPGVAATNPTNAANWTSPAAGGPAVVPPFDGTASIVIPTGLTEYPVLTADVTFYGITIQPGANIDLNGKKLTVGCNVYNSGRINAAGVTNASIIEWKGVSTPQLYTGTNAANTAQFGNFIVNNTASSGQVNITGGPVDVYNTLTLTAGSLTIDNAGNGALTLKSSATQTASVGPITATSITGTVNAERYVPGGVSTSRGYRLLSSPVSNVVSASPATPAGLNSYDLSNLITSTYISGPGTGGTVGTTANSNGFDVTSTTVIPNNPSVFVYKESDLPPANRNVTISDYKGFANKSEYIPMGNGILYFFRGDRTMAQSGNNSGNVFTSPYPYAKATTLKFSGNIIAGPVAVSVPVFTSSATYYNVRDAAVTPGNTKTVTAFSSTLSYTNNSAATDGFNLVGNPFPSTIDLQSVTLGTGISPVIYILNSTLQTYGTYSRTDQSVTNGASRFALSGQGFFVKALSTGVRTVTFPESAKTTYPTGTAPSTIPTVFSSTSTSDSLSSNISSIKIKLIQDSTYYNESILSFSSKHKNEFDNDDASYLNGAGQQIFMYSTTAEGIPCIINRMSSLDKITAPVNLFAEGGITGIYKMEFTGMNSIDKLYRIFLKDSFTKDSLEITANPTYNFNIIRSNAATYGANRFSLIIKQDPAMKIRLLDFDAKKVTKGSMLTWIMENEKSYLNFTVERSINNGKSFEVIGGFQSNGLGKYDLLDPLPVMGLNQYRLKQDKNGLITYSNIVNLMYSQNASNVIINNISIFPNPTNSLINVAITPDSSTVSYTIKIINSIGVLVKSVNSKQPTWQDDVSNLKPGTYFIQVINNTTKAVMGTNKFTKK
jgi:hypothetical protein